MGILSCVYKKPPASFFLLLQLKNNYCFSGKMDHHIPPGYGQENYMYGDPSMVFQGNNEYNMYGPGGPGGRPMSPPPGDEEALPSNENLPTALEEVLAYKEYRVRELGHFGEVEGVDKENKHEPVAVDERREYEVVADENVPEKAKNKKKKTKRHQPKDEDENEQEKNGKNIQEEIQYDDKNPFYRQFAKVFDAFKIIDEKTAKKEEEEEAKKKELQRMLELKKVPKFNDDEDLEDEKKDDDDDKPKISKR